MFSPDAIAIHLILVAMSVKPNFANMTASELRAYVLEHRDDEEALHIYLDKLHAENQNPRIYKPEDNVSEAIAEYLKQKKQYFDPMLQRMDFLLPAPFETDRADGILLD